MTKCCVSSRAVIVLEGHLPRCIGSAEAGDWVGFYMPDCALDERGRGNIESDAIVVSGFSHLTTAPISSPWVMPHLEMPDRFWKRQQRVRHRPQGGQRVGPDMIQSSFFIERHWSIQELSVDLAERQV